MRAIAPRISPTCRDWSTTLRKSGIGCEIVFLRAENETLLKRFSETRRRHPLSRAGLGLQGGARAGAAPARAARQCRRPDDRHVAPVGARTARADPRAHRRARGTAARRCCSSRSPIVTACRTTPISCSTRVRCRIRTGTPQLRDLTGRDDAVAELPRRQAEVQPFLRGRARFHRALAAIARALESQLPDGGGRLHRRPAPLGVPGRATGRTFPATACVAGAGSSSRSREPTPRVTPRVTSNAIESVAGCRRPVTVRTAHRTSRPRYSRTFAPMEAESQSTNPVRSRRSSARSTRARCARCTGWSIRCTRPKSPRCSNRCRRRSATSSGSCVDPEFEGDVLVELNEEVRGRLIRDMDTDELVAAAEGLEVDDLADLLRDLPETVNQRVLRSMDSQDRERLRTVLAYRRGHGRRSHEHGRRQRASRRHARNGAALPAHARRAARPHRCACSS